MGQIKVEKNVGGIEGLCVIEPAVHGDARGYFMETYNEKDMKRTIDNLIDDFVENVDVRDTIVTMSPIDKKKEQIACWVAQSSEAEQKEYLKGLERTIRKLEEVFR